MIKFRLPDIEPDRALSIFGKENGFIFLDSSKTDKRLGRFSMMMFSPFKKMILDSSGLRILENGNEIITEDGVFDFLDSELQTYGMDNQSQYPFVGGLCGYLSYDLGRIIEKIPSVAADDLKEPLLELGYYHGNITFDHMSGEAVYLDYNLDGMAADRYGYILEKITYDEADGDMPKTNLEFRCNMSKDYYLEKINDIREGIRNGDFYQVNFTRRLMTDFDGDSLQLYRKLRKVNPAPFSSFMRMETLDILSSSPERFIEKRGSRISTRPIKGTAPRFDDMKKDAESAKRLLASEKDKSELLMIVDLERNDFGRVAKIGSVKVPEFFVLETYETVHHLVSTVEAEMDESKTISDLIKATFPGGSITGTPKIASMIAIERLEPTRRGIYTGSVGYIDFNRDMDLNIVIRTMIRKDDRLYFQVGGGIVWDSDPVLEYEETGAKALGILKAVNGFEES